MTALQWLPIPGSQVFAAEIRLLHATQYVVVTVNRGLALVGICGAKFNEGGMLQRHVIDLPKQAMAGLFAVLSC